MKNRRPTVTRITVAFDMETTSNATSEFATTTSEATTTVTRTVMKTFIVTEFNSLALLALTLGTTRASQTAYLRRWARCTSEAGFVCVVQLQEVIP